jgi:signal transduction histidine kinase
MIFLMDKQIDDLIRLLNLLNTSPSLEAAAHHMVEHANHNLGSESSVIYLPVDGRYRCLAAAGEQLNHLNHSVLPVPLATLDQLKQATDILTNKNMDLTSPEVAEYLTPFKHSASIYFLPMSLDNQPAIQVLFFPKADDSSFFAHVMEIYRRFGQIGLNSLLQRQQLVQDERDRIARDMHDTVTQAVYSLTILAEGRRRLAARGRLENTVEAFSELGELAQQALRELRLVIHGLRNPLLESHGLVEALNQRLRRVEKRAGIGTNLIVSGTIQLLPEVEIELYRIAEEALNNLLKYSHAANVTGRISYESGEILLEISDDGIGFDLDSIQNEGGMGLTSMKERADKIGAKLQVDSHPGKGTTVRVTISP